MPSNRAQRVLEYAGNALSLVAIFYIGQRLYVYQSQLGGYHLTELAVPVVLLAIVYGASCTLTALAWREILTYLGPRLDLRSALFVYGTSQIAKYIPGNFLHLVGRQTRGIASGIPGLPLAKSMAWEIALLCLSGVLFCILILPQFLPEVGIGMALTGYLAAVLLAALVISRWRDPGLARSLYLNSGFLALSGGLFVILFWLIAPSAATDAEGLLLIGTTYVIAWLAGFITPGAPAGLGVRELVVYTLLQPLAANPEILAAVVASRIVSVLGDLLFFGVAQLVGPPARLPT